MRELLGRRVRHPIAAVSAWSTGVTCAATPWLLEPPLGVRLVASLLAALTTWLVVRVLGATVAVVRGVLSGDAPPGRFVAGVALLLAIGGCTAVPSGVSDAVPVLPVPAVAPAPRPAAGAIMVRVALRAAATDAGRARVAVRDLVHAGGLARRTVLVAVPTGSGWVDESAVRQLERVTAGDVATVTVQYAERPSWVEYPAGQGAATRSATAVLAAVRAELAEVPPDRRPRLFVFGESLGATAVAGAMHRLGPVDGCVLAGRPGSADEPAVPGCLDVRNDDDPIPWWRPGLLLIPSEGLPWSPVSTFWQITGSLVSALGQPDGHGHRYGAELAPAWTTVVQAATRRAGLSSHDHPASGHAGTRR